MRAALVLVLLLALPTLAQATPIPDSVYRVVAVSATWGPGVGYLWGHPQQGARLWLGHGEWGFTIGGSQERYPTGAGNVVLDRWNGPSYDRFVGGFVEETIEDEMGSRVVDIVAWGGGKLNGFEITVIGHT